MPGDNRNRPADLYQTLGLSPDADPGELRNAYHALAIRLHPDKNKSPGAANQFKEISAAYNVLNDPLERQRYDDRRRRSTFEQYLALRVIPSRRTIATLDEPQVLYVLVEVLPGKAQSVQQGETRLNLVLVLDRSLSMKGPRQERLKAAAYQIVDQLNEKDTFGVVAFSDEAEVMVPAGPLADKSAARARIAMMQPFGSTEIYKGLVAGMAEVKRHTSSRTLNHIILLTDGRTFGDEQQALELADQAAKAGVGISAMGMGEEWNDSFLDQLASRTGGTSEYIRTPSAVVRFLNEKVRALGQAYAERVTLSVAPDPDVTLESAFRIFPSAQPVGVDTDPIPFGSVPMGGVVSLLLTLQIGALNVPGPRSPVRLDLTADLLREQLFGYKAVHDLTVNVSNQPPAMDPPVAIVEALNRLSFYRQQERAEQALANGNVEEATHRLELLATRLFANNQSELAQAALDEARRVSETHAFSDAGQKSLKYGTRYLIAAHSAVGSDRLES